MTRDVNKEFNSLVAIFQYCTTSATMGIRLEVHYSRPQDLNNLPGFIPRTEVGEDDPCQEFLIFVRASNFGRVMSALKRHPPVLVGLRIMESDALDGLSEDQLTMLFLQIPHVFKLEIMGGLTNAPERLQTFRKIGLLKTVEEFYLIHHNLAQQPMSSIQCVEILARSLMNVANLQKARIWGHCKPPKGIKWHIPLVQMLLQRPTLKQVIFQSFDQPLSFQEQNCIQFWPRINHALQCLGVDTQQYNGKLEPWIQAAGLVTHHAECLHFMLSQLDAKEWLNIRQEPSPFGDPCLTFRQLAGLTTF